MVGSRRTGLAWIEAGASLVAEHAVHCLAAPGLRIARIDPALSGSSLHRRTLSALREANRNEANGMLLSL